MSLQFASVGLDRGNGGLNVGFCSCQIFADNCMADSADDEGCDGNEKVGEHDVFSLCEVLRRARHFQRCAPGD